MDVTCSRAVRSSREYNMILGILRPQSLEKISNQAASNKQYLVLVL